MSVKNNHNCYLHWIQMKTNFDKYIPFTPNLLHRQTKNQYTSLPSTSNCSIPSMSFKCNIAIQNEWWIQSSRWLYMCSISLLVDNINIARITRFCLLMLYISFKDHHVFNTKTTWIERQYFISQYSSCVLYFECTIKLGCGNMTSKVIWYNKCAFD